MASDRDLIIEHYVKLTDAVDSYRNNWIYDETLVRLITSHWPRLKGKINFTRAALNRALGHTAGKFDTANTDRIYEASFKTICPYEGKRRSVKFYYQGSVDNPIFVCFLL